MSGSDNTFEMDCPDCSKTITVNQDALFARKSNVVTCPNCGELFTAVKPKRPKLRKKNDNQRRSQEQERKAASRYGMRTQPGSGNKSRAKGDLHKEGDRRGECKFTRSKEYKLKLDELMKIESEAKGPEIPFMEVEFQGVFPHKRFVVLDSRHFEALFNG